METLIISIDSFIFSSFTKMIRSLIRPVTISSYYINSPAGGDKKCLMCYVQVKEHILAKKTDFSLLKCVPNLPIK